MITTDQLFAEPFVPEWLSRKNQELIESFDYATTAAIELEYKLMAQENARRIAAKYK